MPTGVDVALLPNTLSNDIKPRWVAALRSNAYKQGHCFLRDENDRYCCMGVLCDVISPDKWKKLPNDPFYRHDGDYYALPSVFSYTIMDMAKSKPFGAVKAKPVVWPLVDLNDNRGFSFAQIADWIERNLTDELELRNASL